jgi:hypothetical protein
MPIVLVLPLLSTTRKLCSYLSNYPFVALGLGDIIIPGICINYSIIYDIASSSSFYIFFVANLAGLFFKIIIVFVLLLLLLLSSVHHNNIIIIIKHYLSLTGYIIGLFLAFIGLVLMNTSQPALFYICPVLLIINVSLSLFRREFKLYWSGSMVNKFLLALVILSLLLLLIQSLLL